MFNENILDNNVNINNNNIFLLNKKNIEKKIPIESELNYKYSNDNLYYRNEIALWKAVILQALIDLQSNSKKKIANTYRIKALMWFNLKNEDFIKTCNYAGLDPKYVYERAMKVKSTSKFLI